MIALAAVSNQSKKITDRLLSSQITLSLTLEGEQVARVALL